MDEWELPKEEFDLEEELGSGCFAHVYRGRWKNLIKVAIKILKSGISPSLLITSGFCSDLVLCPPPDPGLCSLRTLFLFP